MHIQRRKTGTKSNPLVTGLTVFCRNRFLPLSKRGRHLPIDAMMTVVIHLKQQKPQVFLKKVFHFELWILGFVTRAF